MMLPSTTSPSAEHRQYGLLWGWVLPQVVERLSLPPTPSCTKLVYQAFKEYLGYDSLAGTTADRLSRFTYELLATMAVEFGVYIRLPYEPEPKEAQQMEDMSLRELWPENYKQYWSQTP